MYRLRCEIDVSADHRDVSEYDRVQCGRWVVPTNFCKTLKRWKSNVLHGSSGCTYMQIRWWVAADICRCRWIISAVAYSCVCCKHAARFDNEVSRQKEGEKNDIMFSVLEIRRPRLQVSHGDREAEPMACKDVGVTANEKHPIEERIHISSLGKKIETRRFPKSFHFL